MGKTFKDLRKHEDSVPKIKRRESDKIKKYKERSARKKIKNTELEKFVEDGYFGI